MAEYNLSAAASKVKEARANFAFFQGKKSNQVYISPGRAGGKAVAELNNECGDPKQLFRGVCFLEEEQLVFATKAKPSMTWEVMMTKVFKEKKAARFLPIVLRQLGENESDEVVAGSEQGETAATAAPTAEQVTEPAAAAGASDEAEWRKLKAELTPRANVALRAGPSNQPELLGLIKRALEAEKSGQFGDAVREFRALEAKLPPPAAPAAGAATPPPPPGGKVLSASELSLAMQKIVPRLQQAVAANPARRAEILAPAGKFQAALRTGKFADAQVAMMEALALAKTLAPAQPASSAPTPSPNADTAGSAAAATIDPEDDEDFTETWRDATKVWLECVGTVDAQIEKVRVAMRQSGDPDFQEIADKGLTALTDNHKTPVMAAVRDVDAARGEKRVAAAVKARVAINKFRKHLVADRRIAICDQECEGEFGVRLTIRDEISRGLDELEMALEDAPSL